MGIIRDYIDGMFGNDEQDAVGIGGFTTFAKIRENVSRTRQVPTTYLEDGSFVGDHIIRDPVSLSIKGQVSEIYLEPSALLEQIRTIEASVGAVAQYAPTRTRAQLSKISSLVGSAQSMADKADKVVSDAQRIGKLVGLIDKGKSNIETFIDEMEGFFYSDTLISIDAPFRTYENMSITFFSHERNAETESLSFNIEAQEVRLAETLFIETAAKNPASGTDGQTKGASDKGTQSGEPVDQSFASSMFERWFN